MHDNPRADPAELDARIRRALGQDRTIDITTVGRRTGSPRRTEIWFHNVAGRIYISGLPGTRGWYANLLAHPDFTFHLKETVHADIDAHARPITRRAEREAVLRELLAGIGRVDAFDDWVARSPLVEVQLDLPRD
jgi:deazaflavin-dependent oxidoreductase (nitroreductase family)